MVEKIVGIREEGTQLLLSVLRHTDDAVAPCVYMSCVRSRDAHYLEVDEQHESRGDVEHHHIGYTVEELIVRSTVLLFQEYCIEGRGVGIEMNHNSPQCGVEPYTNDQSFTPARCQNVPVVVGSDDGDVAVDTDDEKVGDRSCEECDIARVQSLKR